MMAERMEEIRGVEAEERARGDMLQQQVWDMDLALRQMVS